MSGIGQGITILKDVGYRVILRRILKNPYDEYTNFLYDCTYNYIS